jgi:hypothetical protein
MEKSSPLEVTVRIEQIEPNQYIVHAAHLEQIGALIRGDPRASILRSIGWTTLVGAFITAVVIPYVTWLATMNLQHATDHAEKGVSIYEKAAAALDRHWNAANDFYSTVKNTVSRPAKANGAIFDLYKDAQDVQRSRWVSYYDELTTWNNEYDGILESVDYILDRSILVQIEPTVTVNKITEAKTKKVDCARSLSLGDQLDRAGYVQHSLKAQFAVIGYCLKQIDDRLRPQAIVNDHVANSEPGQKLLQALLDNTHTMASTFRCHADSRLQYFYKLKNDATFTMRKATLTALKMMTFSTEETEYDPKNEDSCA